MNDSISAKKIRQLFTLTLILFLGILIFREMLPYLSGVLGAITFYVLMRSSMSWLLRKGWNANLAATMLMILSFIGILLPVAGIIVMLGNKIGDVATNSERLLEVIKLNVEKIERTVKYDISSQIDISGISQWVTDSLQSFAGGTFDVIIAVGLMYFLLYYMLTNRKKLRESLYDYIPINRKNLKEIGQEAQNMVKSNAIGIPLVAVAQGIVALIGFLIFGIEDPFFWFVIVTVGSMIPFVGTIVGILPVFLLTLASGSSFQAWGILLYGLVIVASTDNIIRLFVLKKLDNVHPLVTLIGVIVGVPLFGFIGLIFGPLLLSLFMLIVKIYRKEYGKNISHKADIEL